jgi:hypothetical protein
MRAKAQGRVGCLVQSLRVLPVNAIPQDASLRAAADRQYHESNLPHRTSAALSRAPLGIDAAAPARSKSPRIGDRRWE